MLEHKEGLQHPRLGAHDNAYAWPSSNSREQHHAEPHLGAQHQRLGGSTPSRDIPKIYPQERCNTRKAFDLQEGQYPEIAEQIGLRGWRRLSKPRTKISKDLVHEFYSNAVRTEEELASREDYPYTSYVRGKEVDFSAAKIREVLRIRHMTLGAETDFKTRQMEDQRLDDVIREICMPGAQWKMSSNQPPHPIQLRRQNLTPVARGWAEFIIHSMIPTGNKSEINVARAVLIHSIIKGHDVRVEELIADNIAVLVEGVQGRSKLCFPSTIYRL
ncbi:hypothetical protein PIB30_074159 [Stylosanthes scabra]|uniref:Putative plant transposon protein domain-containing protein n=1 Tax=Stylosanthes scabra TaxID=79078 RepID=A0ABU6VS50_9FABA|nr:hypothetical protein [Stylosanthes scabra]